MEKPSCDNCGYETELKVYQVGYPEKKYSFCLICASTYLDKATTYPDQCSDTSLYRSIGWIANFIIDTIKKS